MLFLPRRWRIVCFFIVTPWEMAVILTANYTFLNYLVMSLGVLLLDDRFFERWMPAKWKVQPAAAESGVILRNGSESERPWQRVSSRVRRIWQVATLSASAILLSWIFYATTAELLTNLPLPKGPVIALEPLRIANQYGLFAVMTRGRYEIEFQGSMDGQTWVAYPFRYKPQELNQPPRIYAPYQPRFDWNLWFASLGSWRQYPIVPNTELQLLSNDKDVLGLFAGNPFEREPPRRIRVLLWQYWFTTMKEKRETGMWWRRQSLGLYAPTVERTETGEINVVELPTVPPRE